MSDRSNGLDAPTELAMAQVMQRHILDVLKARLGPVPDDVTDGLRQVTSRPELKDLHNLAASRADFDVLRAALRHGAGPYLGRQVTQLAEEQGFLLSLKSSPDEVTTLVYADWLEERGELKAAEFLRSLVALGRAGDVRELNEIVERWPGVSECLNRDWTSRCVALLARRPMRFRILDARVQDERSWRPQTHLRGVLQSGSVRRGDGLLVPCRDGQAVRKYVAWVLADSRVPVRAGQQPLEFSLVVRDQLDAAPGSVIVSPEPDTELDKLLNRPIEALGLSVRALNCLESDGLTTIRDLVSRTDEELLEVRSFGETTLREVNLRLPEFGLRLGMLR
jgi:uncharacterized protein (TIGR02996 family)